MLAGHLIELLPPGATVLDIGAGDGLLAARMARLRPDLHIRGVDTNVRPAAAVPVQEYDGVNLPVSDRSVDVAMLVDVVHHAADPIGLLREASRVGRNLVIKDHLQEGFAARCTLRFMDRVGNARYGISIPGEYWTRRQLEEAFGTLGLRVEAWRERLGLYPKPLAWLFERSLHFLTRLTPARP